MTRVPDRQKLRREYLKRKAKAYTQIMGGRDPARDPPDGADGTQQGRTGTARVSGGEERTVTNHRIENTSSPAAFVALSQS